MKFIVLLEDSDDADPGLRSRHMSAHLTFLESNASKVDAAGPLFKVDGANAGGLWIVEADGAESIERLIHEDPFWPTGLRKSYTILNWKRVFADRKRLIK